MRRPLLPHTFLALALLVGCSSAAQASAPHVKAPSPGGGLKVVAVGDSITAADSSSFDEGTISQNSWAAYANGDGVQILGGWAHGGATTGDMLAGVRASVSHDVDVLVLMGGSNDVDAHVPTSVVEKNLDAIARTVATPRVVLSTIPPEDAVAPAVQQLNAALPALARREGWQLVDPMIEIRDSAGHYLPGMTKDGVHPSAPAARLIGQALHRALTG